MKSSDDEFDWETLMNWHSSPEIESQGTNDDFPLNHQPIDHPPLSISSEPLTKKRGRKTTLLKDVGGLKEYNKIYNKSRYLNKIKKDEKQYQNHKINRMRYYYRLKEKKENFMNSLNEKEKQIELLKQKQLGHEKYNKRKARGGVKSTRTRVILNLIEQKKATSKDLEELEKIRKEAREKRKFHRLKAMQNKQNEKI